jgi:hypothetical protein
VLVLLFGGMQLIGNINGINNGSDLGALLSGTLGVVIGLGTMIAIIITLKEQQKMNLISKYERFMTLFKQYKINELWYHGDDNDVGVEKLLSCSLRNNTFKELFKICNNSELSQLSNDLNLLVKVEYENMVMNEIWDAIPVECKKYAGFYFSWNERFFESRKNRKDITNKLIDIFCTEMKERYPEIPDFLPDNIPRIEIDGTEHFVSFDEKKLKNMQIEIKSKSSEIIEIEKSEIIFSEGDSNEFHNKIDIPSNSDKEYFINNLFTIDRFYKKIRNLYSQQSDEERSFIRPKIKLHMKYKGNKWVYECFLEFNIYRKPEGVSTSIIFTQIPYNYE